MSQQANKSTGAIIFVCLFQMFFLCSVAQVQTARYISMTPMSNSFYEYLPQGYNSSSIAYPLLIFAHGSGEYGDGSPSQITKVLRNGTPKQISQGIFPKYFLVNADTFRYLVLSPQFTQYPTPQDINNIIDYAILHYRVDINRIYLTGLSAGGGNVWDYAGFSTNYAYRIAAIVPVCGFAYPTPENCEAITAAGVRVWATHNDADPTVPSSYTVYHVNYINGIAPPPDSLAKKTIFVSSSHNAWSRTYDTSFRENNLNVYEWMLQYKRSYVTLPVSGLIFDARKTGSKVLLHWQTSSENRNRGFEVERSSSGLNFTSIGFVNSAGNSINSTEYNFTDQLPLRGKNYYRLKQMDIDNHVKYSVVRFVDFNAANKISIYPNPVSDLLNINSSYDFQQAQLKIYDMSGRLVKASTIRGNGTSTIPVKDLPAARYSVEIREAAITFKSSFIKQ